MRSIADFIAFPGRVWVILASKNLAKLTIDFIGFIIPNIGGHIFSKTDVFLKNTFISDELPSDLMNTYSMMNFNLQIDIS